MAAAGGRAAVSGGGASIEAERRRRSRAFRTATGGQGVVFRCLVSAVNQLLLPHPLVVCRRVLPDIFTR